LVDCNDHVICKFDKYGKITPGWGPRLTTGMVEFPLQHFRVGARDYIVFFDKSRTYILDRQGKERVGLKNDFEHSGNDIGLIWVNGSAASMVTTDKLGNVKLMRFDGTVKSIKLGKYSSGHYFLPVDFSGKGSPDFLFCDKQKLYRFDQSGKLIFAIDVAIQVDQSPKLVLLGKKRLIVLNSKAENRSILVRADGSIFNGLPSPEMLQVVGTFDDRYNVVNYITWSAEGFLSNYQMKSP